MARCLGELPAMYSRITEMLTDPPRRAGRAFRVPPGSRVLLSAEADALMRTSSGLIGAWAARVRTVPQLSLSRHGFPHGSADQVAADCRTLAAHPGPLLALAPAPMYRTWTYPPGKPGGMRPRPVPCRRCSLPVSPSPSGKYWWPAVCVHPAAMTAAYREEKDGSMTPVAWACAACSTRLPQGHVPPPRCAHAATGTTVSAEGIPADIEEETADLEVIYAGDGWVTCLTELGGRAAGLDVIDLRAAAARLLQETPAPPEWIDGVQCRRCECEAYALFRAPLPVGAGESARSQAYSECAACRDRMTREEYGDWVKLNGAYARHDASPVTCRRCKREDHGECRWAPCACMQACHPRRRAAALPCCLLRHAAPDLQSRRGYITMCT